MSPDNIPVRFEGLWYLHLLFISDHKRLDPFGILGAENERNTILETSENPQRITEHNNPEDMHRGSDLCSRPTEFRARTTAFILQCSINKIMSYLIGFTSLRICETMFSFSIYVLDQKLHNINNIIIRIIYDKENLTTAFVGLLHKFKCILPLMQVYGTFNFINTQQAKLFHLYRNKGKGKVILLQARCGPVGG